MDGIYNYLPETSHVARVYNIVFIQFLQFMLHVMLFPMLNVLYCYVSTSEVCVQCPIVLWALFSSSLSSCIDIFLEKIY